MEDPELLSVTALLKFIVFAIGLVIISIGVTQSGQTAWIIYGLAAILYIVFWVGTYGTYWW